MGAGENLLFPEPTPGGPDGKLSWKVGKRLQISRRRALGDSREVDYPSLRRRYVTAAEHAGGDPVAIAGLAGHEATMLAAKVYSGGAGRRRLEELQRTIERAPQEELDDDIGS